MIGDIDNHTPAGPLSLASQGRNDSDVGAVETGTPEDLLLTAKAWYRADREHSEDWRKDAKEDFDFVAGHQWSDEDKEVLREQLRPEITFNRIAPTVESVIGIEIGNRRESATSRARPATRSRTRC